MHTYSCSALVTDCRSKVRDLVLVKRIHPQPSTAVVPRVFTESLRFRCQGDGTFHLKIVPWPKFKNEIQFTHFLGSERQSRPAHTSCIEENFHIAQVFRLAGAIGLPASILHDTPLPCSQPPQEDPREKRDLPFVPKCNDLTIRERPPSNPKHQAGDSTDTPVSSNALGAHQVLASEIERLPLFSTSKAWYREKFFSSILNLPTRVRSEQCASRERERSQVINDVDRLCATLDATTFEEQNINGVPIDSGFKQKSCGSSSQAGGSSNQSGGSSNQASGPVSSRNLVKRNGQRSADSGKPKPNRKRSKQSKKSGSESESENGARKRKRGSDPEPSYEFKCRIYEKSNIRQVYTYKTCKGKTYANYKDMIDHILRVHIKPFQCGRCMARFGRHSERNRHEGDVCEKKGLVERTKEDPNDVPDYVLAMGKNISLCRDNDSLDSVLYDGDQKKYDYLDKTDVGKNTTFYPALEESPGEPTHPISWPPLSIISHDQELKTIESRRINVEPYPEGRVNVERHNQIFNNHIDNPFFNLGSQSSGFDGGPSGLDLVNELTNDLVPNIINSSETYTDTALEIEKIITNHSDAEKDPKRFQELMSILLANLPKKLSDDLVVHIRTSPHIAPDFLSETGFGVPHFLNKYAREVVSEGDEIPVPDIPPPDSGFDSNQTDAERIQLLKDFCDFSP